MRRYLTGALILVVAACVNPFNPARDITLLVRDLVVPASIPPGGPLSIRFNVVSGGCKSFERVEARRGTNQLTLEARGVDHGGPGISCTTDIRIDPQTYDAAGPFSDRFVVEVVQPDGSTLARTVRVQ